MLIIVNKENILKTSSLFTSINKKMVLEIIQHITVPQSLMERSHSQGEIRKIFTSIKCRPTVILSDNFFCIREHREANAFLMCSSIFNYLGKVHFQSPFILKMTLSPCAVGCRDAKKIPIRNQNTVGFPLFRSFNSK